MSINKTFFLSFQITLKRLLRCSLIAVPVAVAIGSAVALFMWLLNWAIHFRFAHPWLLYFLPLTGVAIYLAYKYWGDTANRGNNLIMDEIHQPGGGVPKRMTPFVLIATVVTHLFGGSAGREGTAVQMGGSIAQAFSKWFKLNTADTAVILIAGIAAGFGAVFGTPLTGALFAMEVLTLGRIQYKNAWLPCLVAGIVADCTFTAWGLHHTAYHITIDKAIPHLYHNYFPFDGLLLAKVIVASIAFGMASWFFSVSVHGVKDVFNKFIAPKWAIPALGGLIIIALTFIIGKPDYLSLGVNAEYPGAITISSAFNSGGADTWSWLWKTIYTTITLGTGFKGGEVTPLFYIGATLGNSLSVLMDAPVALFAALGFIAVFAGATNTPLACTLMGVELFGAQYALFFAVACFTAYLFSGHGGIYVSQQKNTVHFIDEGYLARKLKRYTRR
ncbi:MAG: voltage-gated chloride channel family protein [Bacteroidota bacterium]